jgi:hypothetical protein
MHQSMHGSWHEAVVHEHAFLDVEALVAALEIASPVRLHPVSERQVLRPRRSANRICLHEPTPLDCTRQRGRREKRSRDCEPPK